MTGKDEVVGGRHLRGLKPTKTFPIDICLKFVDGMFSTKESVLLPMALPEDFLIELRKNLSSISERLETGKVNRASPMVRFRGVLTIYQQEGRDEDYL